MPGTTQGDIKSRFINDLYLFPILDIQDRYCAKKHKYTGHDQSKDGMIMKNVFNDWATKNPVYDLRASDKKIKYTHINPNFLYRDRA